MSLAIAELSLSQCPHAFISKRGEAGLVKLLDTSMHGRLVEMYLEYQPRDEFQGLPPIQDDACVKWVRGVIHEAVNLVALTFDHGIVGHLALFPGAEGRCEMLVVVRPEFQNQGIGTQLVRCSSQVVQELGFEEYWLTVELNNARARHIYRKCGFEPIRQDDPHEVDMALDLRAFQHISRAPIAEVMNHDAIVIDKAESCETALRMILDHAVASLPVVESGRLVGILTETDLMLPDARSKMVRDVYTRQVVTVEADCPLGRVVRLFQSRSPRVIPVIDADHHLKGVVSRKDVLTYYAARSY